MARSVNGEWTYDRLAAILGDKDHKSLMGNTWASRMDDGSIGVVYHSTMIARLWSDGRVRLDSGGWQTSTTKHRMNGVMPAGMGVCQKDFKWYVGIWGYREITGEWVDLKPRSVLFVDGMVIETSHAHRREIGLTPRAIANN